MSSLELLIDVVDEVYESERALGEDDIPDRRVFKHVKTLWQLLLGIQESRFDSSNYEPFELRFENRKEVFTGFLYFGTEFELRDQTLDNAVGSPTESMKIVQSLDEETSVDAEDVSVSFKLSMLNKIRYILFRHHMIVSELFDESELVKIIATSMLEDILNVSNDVLLISLQSNNSVFDACYQEGLEKFLLTETSVAVEDIAKEIVISFKRDARIAYFFNVEIVMNFHKRIIELLKHIYRKHRYVGIEIEQYYKQNPVLPILRPVYRKMTIEKIRKDANAEKDTTLMTERLNIKMIIEVIEQVSEDESLQEDVDIPVTLRLFPHIIRYYCDSLSTEGINDLENDIYITLIKNEILQWIEGNIELKEFVPKLADLSLIPTALPYSFQGVVFPTVHMRMALYCIKEHIRLYETYFEIWKSETKLKQCLDKKINLWKNYVKERFLMKWIEKTKRINDLQAADKKFLDKSLLLSYYKKWKTKSQMIEAKIQIANTIQTRTYFNKWITQYRIFKTQSENADLLYNHKILINYFTTWVSVKVFQFPDLLERFDKHKKKNFFQLWKKSWYDSKNLEQNAGTFERRYLLSSFFGKWVRHANGPLLRLNLLEENSEKFVMKLHLDKWKMQMKLISNEAKIRKRLEKALLKKQFNKWYYFKKLSDFEHKVSTQNHTNLCKRYLQQWHSVYIMSAKANSIYLNTRAIYFFKLWKLQTFEKAISKKQKQIKVKNYLKIWKLKATAKQYKQSKDDLLLENSMQLWHAKYIYMQQQVKYCNDAHLTVKQALYFDFWRRQYKSVQSLQTIADRFNDNRKLHETNILRKWIWKTIKDRYRNLKEKNHELNRINGVHASRMLEKVFKKWKTKKLDFHILEERATEFKRLNYTSKYFDRWLDKYEQVLTLQNAMSSKMDTENVAMLMKIFSKLQLKMIKFRTDRTNADQFKERWDRLKTRTFFELWKYKQTTRTSPTPTARNKNITGINVDRSLPELNPYIDLAPRDRGSPEYRPYLSTMKSVLNGKISQYDISSTMTGDNFEMGMPPGTGSTLVTSNNAFKTPVIRRTNSKFLHSLQSKMSPDKMERHATSAERVRRKHLEERVSRYRLLRSPPKTTEFHLEKVEESTNEANSEIYQNSSLFNVSTESMINSTPVRMNTKF